MVPPSTKTSTFDEQIPAEDRTYVTRNPYFISELSADDREMGRMFAAARIEASAAVLQSRAQKCGQPCK